MKRKKIAITTTSFAKEDRLPLELLSQSGMDVVMNPYGRKMEKPEIIKICLDASGMIAGTEKLDEDTLKKISSVKIISRCGTGLDNVDLKAVDRLKIKVFNTPDAPTSAVAELTVGLILNLLRKITEMDSGVRNGKWEKLMGSLLAKKKVGIIGFGRIGRKVAQLLKVFDCELAYFDPAIKDKDNGFPQLPLNDLLKWADIISMHASSKEQILGPRELRLMKKGAWLVSVSRGGALDESVLFEYLLNGHLSGAALDVYEKEPYAGPLTELKNVILTPHIGSYAREARVNMEIEAVRNLLKGLKEGQA